MRHPSIIYLPVDQSYVFNFVDFSPTMFVSRILYINNLTIRLLAFLYRLTNIVK